MNGPRDEDVTRPDAGLAEAARVLVGPDACEVNLAATPLRTPGEQVDRFDRFVAGLTQVGSYGAAWVLLGHALRRAAEPSLSPAARAIVAASLRGHAARLRARVADDLEGARVASSAAGGRLLRLLGRLVALAQDADLAAQAAGASAAAGAFAEAADHLCFAHGRLKAPAPRAPRDPGDGARSPAPSALRATAVVVAKDALAPRRDLGIVLPWGVREHESGAAAAQRTALGAPLDATTAAAVDVAGRAVGALLRRADLRERLRAAGPDVGLREADFGGVSLYGPSIGPAHFLALLAHVSGVPARSDVVLTGRLEEARASAATPRDAGRFRDALERWRVRPVGDVCAKLAAVRRDAPWVTHVGVPAGVHVGTGMPVGPHAREAAPDGSHASAATGGALAGASAPGGRRACSASDARACAGPATADAELEDLLGPDAAATPPALEVVSVETLWDVVRLAFAPDNLARLPGALGWPRELDPARYRATLEDWLKAVAKRDAERFVPTFELGGCGFVRLTVEEDVLERERLGRNALGPGGAGAGRGPGGVDPAGDDPSGDEAPPGFDGDGDDDERLGRSSRRSVGLDDFARELSARAGGPVARLLIGDGGAGKTTALRYLALKLADDPEGPLPFLLHARDLADVTTWDPGLARAPGLAPVAVAAATALARLARARGDATGALSVDASEFAAWLEAGKAVLLIDGLDEVFDDTQRERVRAYLEDFVAEGGAGVPVVIGSRETGLDLLAERTFTRCRVAPLGPREHDDLLEVWVSDASARDALRKRLTGRTDAFGRSPLLLALAVKLHGAPGARGGGDPLGNPVEAFREAARLLLVRWPRRREGPRGAHAARAARELPSRCRDDDEADEVLELLERLSLALLDPRASEDAAAGEPRGVSVPEAERHAPDRRLLRRLVERVAAPAERKRARRFVKLALAAGLLVPFRDGLTFLHRSFQEAFAGLALAAAPEIVRLGIVDAIADPRRTAYLEMSWESPLAFCLEALAADCRQDEAEALVLRVLPASDAAEEDDLIRSRLGLALRLLGTEAVGDAIGRRVAERARPHVGWLPRRFLDALARSPWGLDLVEVALGSDDHDVCLAAAKGLARKPGERVLGLIARALGHASEGVREAAARALAGKPGERAFGLIERVLRDEKTWRVCKAAAEALPRQPCERTLGFAERALRADTAASAGGRGAGAHWVAASALCAHPGERALALIESALGDERGFVRARAALALSGQRGEQALGLIERALSDKCPSVRTTATEALSGHHSERGLGLIEHALCDEDCVVRRAAASALAGQQGERALGLIARALSDKDEFVRDAAAQALCWHRGERALELIELALRDASKHVRQAAAAAVAGQTERAFGVLERILVGRPRVPEGHYDDYRLRWGAARALSRLSGERALWLVGRAMEDHDPFVAAIAAAALSRLSGERALDLFELALGRHFGIEEAARALSKHSGGRSLDMITRALTDSELAVREAAARALAGQSRERGLALAEHALRDESAWVRDAAAASAEWLLRTPRTACVPRRRRCLPLDAGSANSGALLVQLAEQLALARAGAIGRGLDAQLVRAARHAAVLVRRAGGGYFVALVHAGARTASALARSALPRPADPDVQQESMCVAGRDRPQLPRGGVVSRLASLYWQQERAQLLALRAGFPAERMPAFGDARTFWAAVCREIAAGARPGRVEPLLDAALEDYPVNDDLRALRGFAGVAPGCGELAASLEVVSAALHDVSPWALPDRIEHALCLAIAGGETGLLLPWSVEPATRAGSEPSPDAGPFLPLGPQAQRELRLAEEAAVAARGGRALPPLVAGVRARREDFPLGLDGPSVALAHFVGVLAHVAGVYPRADAAYTGRIEVAGDDDARGSGVARYRVGPVAVRAKAEAVRLSGTWIRTLGVPADCEAEAEEGLAAGEARLRRAFAGLGAPDPGPLAPVTVRPLRDLGDVLDLAFWPEDRARILGTA